MLKSPSLTGEVFDRDKSGNSKVRTREWGRFVVLRDSARRNYNLGDIVVFRVAKFGEAVDFSDRHSLKGERSIELLLRDTRTGDVLIVGYWNGNNAPNITGERDGEIDNMKYIFSLSLCKDEQSFKHLIDLLRVKESNVFTGRYNAESLPSLLRAAIMPYSHPDRIDLEKVVMQYMI